MISIYNYLGSAGLLMLLALFLTMPLHVFGIIFYAKPTIGMNLIVVGRAVIYIIASVALCELSLFLEHGKIVQVILGALALVTHWRFSKYALEKESKDTEVLKHKDTYTFQNFTDFLEIYRSRTKLIYSGLYALSLGYLLFASKEQILSMEIIHFFINGDKGWIYKFFHFFGVLKFLNFLIMALIEKNK